MALSTSVLKQRLAHQQWTSHNIRLNDEVTTNSELHDFLAGDDRLKAILRVFSLLFPHGLNGVRVADLGCLEGGFTLALAMRGAQALGVEARETNWRKLELLHEHFELPNLEFRRGDVKEFDAKRFGQFDAGLALGILYHLDRPAEWLRQIGPAVKKVLVVDSHYAPAQEEGLERLDARLCNLSGIERVRAGSFVYEGRWFREYAPGSNPEGNLWASYSNWRSFWLTKESLLRAIRDAGFPLVLEQHDYSVGQYWRLIVEFPRTMVVAIKI